MLIEADGLLKEVAAAVTGAKEAPIFSQPDDDEGTLNFWDSSSLWGDAPEWRDEERKEQDDKALGRAIYEQSTPGSSGSFQAAQAATAFTDSWGGYENGRIPTSEMTTVERGVHYLRDDAAKAYKAMQRAIKKDLGRGFDVTDSYRDYDTQVRLKNEKPDLAATPGTSRHGWGLALDINVNDPRVLEWLRTNGERYGFYELRHSDGSEFEPWHWDYKGGFEGEAPPTKTKPTKRLEGRRRPEPQTNKTDQRRIQTRNLSLEMGLANVLDDDTPFYQRNIMTPDGSGKLKQPAGKFLKLAPTDMRKWFRQAAKESGLPVGLLVLVAQKESGFNPQAVSSAGAQGVMQIMPLHNLDNPFDAKTNIMFGAKLLAGYIEQMGSVRGGLAAYNGGPGNPQYDYADSILEIWRGN